MKKLTISVAALLLVTACGQQAEEQQVAEQPRELRSGIGLDGMDPNIRPGDDFFAYVNGTWVESTEIPADKARYGTFDILRDESQENVKVIIEESATGDFAKGTDEQKVGDLYRSFMDMDTRDARGIEPLQPELDRIDAISNYDDLAVYFASVMKRNPGRTVRHWPGGGLQKPEAVHDLRRPKRARPAGQGVLLQGRRDFGRAARKVS